MKRKYDKYWGNPESLNMLLLIAVVLNPQYKLIFVNWQISQVFNYDVAIQLKGKLESCLKSLFEEYRHEMGEGLQGESQSSSYSRCNNDRYRYHQFLQSSGPNKSELSKYLEESLEGEDLNIRIWSNLNSSRFSILGKIVRDVLAIPLTIVASELAFSTGGRVFDPYRSSLTPRMVEALICTQDWLKETHLSMLPNEDFEELEKFEQDKINQV
ncbi:hypothetical protein Fmac_017523 [Flemingia macrophylla]|uniref:HAT C-terminal dimerisation domain-containing protein n=1 Tax=Flemingia macrophylla TaxID=520843 RepID=A0ABD1M2S7_9FABA